MYPTKISRFAVQFTDMADAFQNDATLVFPIECKTPEQAAQLRLQFYAFRNAARKTGEIKNFPIVEAVEATIAKGTNTTVFQCKDYSWMAKALDEGLRK